MANKNGASIGNRFPFIASAITGVIAYLLTFFYLKQQLGFLMFAGLAVMVVLLLLKIDLWGFVGGLLIAFLIEAIRKEAYSDVVYLSVILIIGAFLSMILTAWNDRVSPSVSRRASIGRNALFALGGVGISLTLLQILYGPVYSLEPIIARQDVTTVDYFNTVCLFLIFRFFVSPFFWSPLLASLRQIGIRPFQFRKTIIHMLKGILGATIASAIASVFPVCLAIIQPMLPEIKDPSSPFIIISSLSYLVVALAWIYGIGWGVSWGH